MSPEQFTPRMAPVPGRLVSLDTLLDVFWSTWHERDGQVVLFNKGDEVNSIGHMADRMFRAFQASSFARPSGTIIGVEEELRGQIIQGLPNLLARVDLMVDEADALVIYDFKSTRSSWSEDQVTDAAGQLLLYRKLAKPMADGKPHDVPVNSHQVERTKRIVERVWRSIQAGHFFPAPSPLNCHSCPYRSPCRAWKG